MKTTNQPNPTDRTVRFYGTPESVREWRSVVVGTGQKVGPVVSAMGDTWFDAVLSDPDLDTLTRHDGFSTVELVKGARFQDLTPKDLRIAMHVMRDW